MTQCLLRPRECPVRHWRMMNSRNSIIVVTVLQTKMRETGLMKMQTVQIGIPQWHRVAENPLISVSFLACLVCSGPYRGTLGTYVWRLVAFLWDYQQKKVDESRVPTN